MASFYPCVKNGASGYIFYVSLVSQANTKITQVNPTLAAGDVKIAIDDAAPVNLTTLPVVDADFTKRVKVVLSQAEVNGDNLSIVFNDAAGAEWCDLTINIQTVLRRFDDLAYPATSGRSMVVDVDGLVDVNAVKVGPTGSGTAQTTGDIIADTNDIQARLPAALTVNGNMKSSLMEIISTTLTETVGQIAAAFKQFFDIASPTGTMKAITNVVTTTNLTTNNDKTGYSLTQTFPSNFSNLSISATTGLVDITQTAADKAWGTAARLLTAGTNIVLAKGTGVTGFNDLDTAGVAAATWNAATATYGSAGSYGLLIETDLDAAITSRSTYSGGAVASVTAGVTVTTNNDKTGYELSTAGVDSILDDVVEGTLTFRQIIRIMLASLAGKSAGGGTATITFKGVDGTTTRITATVDGSGDRTAITIDGA